VPVIFRQTLLNLLWNLAPFVILFQIWIYGNERAIRARSYTMCRSRPSRATRAADPASLPSLPLGPPSRRRWWEPPSKFRAVAGLSRRTMWASRVADLEDKCRGGGPRLRPRWTARRPTHAALDPALGGRFGTLGRGQASGGGGGQLVWDSDPS
jgi:hypothetical protein